MGKPKKCNSASLGFIAITVIVVIPPVDIHALAQVANSTNATSPQSMSSSHFLTYQNSTAGFKMQYPSYFQKFENSTSNSSAVYFVEPLSGVRVTVANFKIPQINLLNEPKNLIVATYFNGFTQPFQLYNSSQSSTTTLGGNPANRTELTYFSNDNPARTAILSSLFISCDSLMAYSNSLIGQISMF